MNLTGTLKRVRFGATSDLNFFEAKNWATWRQWVNTKEWLSSIDSGPRANFNMPVSFHKHISSEKSTLMIVLGLYKFGCQNVPVSSRLLYTVCSGLYALRAPAPANRLDFHVRYSRLVHIYRYAIVHIKTVQMTVLLKYYYYAHTHGQGQSRRK